LKQIAEQYGDAMRVPTLILFHDGVEKERIVGVVSQEKISRTIDRYIGRDLVSSL
jgi:hypothetical protein